MTRCLDRWSDLCVERQAYNIPTTAFSSRSVSVIIHLHCNEEVLISWEKKREETTNNKQHIHPNTKLNSINVIISCEWFRVKTEKLWPIVYSVLGSIAHYSVVNVRLHRTTKRNIGYVLVIFEKFCDQWSKRTWFKFVCLFNRNKRIESLCIFNGLWKIKEPIRRGNSVFPHQELTTN